MLLQKIQEYIKKYSLKDLAFSSSVWVRVILSILALENKKYNKSTLDVLYEFFKLEKDDFYMQNMKKWYPKTETLLGSLFRLKRIWKNKDIHDIAKDIKMEKRALARLESGDALPNYNSYTIQKIIEVLEFSDLEKKIIKDYISSMKNIEALVKKYDI